VNVLNIFMGAPFFVKSFVILSQFQIDPLPTFGVVFKLP